MLGLVVVAVEGGLVPVRLPLVVVGGWSWNVVVVRWLESGLLE